MRAYVLAAGNGNRLRPLTSYVPKPMVPMMNQPLVSHLLDHLRPHVTHTRLNVSYKKEPLIEFLSGQTRVSYFDEGEKPVGSARSLYLEGEYCRSDTTLVVCGDILSNWNIEQMLRFHHANKALVTVAVRSVPNPSNFGVVVTNRNQRIVQFVEKPKVPPSQFISCGIYLFAPALFEQWDPEWRDIGSELLPDLVNHNLPIYAWPMDSLAFWSDIGNPQSYLHAHLRLAGGTNVIARTAKIGQGVRLSETVVGAKASIHARATLNRCVVWPSAVVQRDTYLSNAIVTNDEVLEVAPLNLLA